jgi:hypothetical protein
MKTSLAIVARNPMKFYFSGIAEKKTFALLSEAKVTNILTDPTDAKNIPFNRRIGILDSGAYKYFAKGKDLDLRTYLAHVATLEARCDYIVAPDVIGNAGQTFINWQVVKDAPLVRDKLIPVWQFNAPKEHLEAFLQESRLVGIGGLAKTFHNNKTAEEKRLREETLKSLLELCAKYPQRFHIFGLNFLKAVEQLAPFAFSCDSSNWLRGKKYGFVIFKHSINGHLTQAPARAIAEYQDLTPDQRCVVSARNIENFLNELAAANLKKAA